MKGCLGLQINILQIADVVHRVVFLLFLLCFQLIVRLLPTSEMFHHFVVTTKTTQPLLQVFYNPRHKSWNTCVIFRSPMLIWVCSHFSAPKYARLNIGDLSKNKGVKGECKKFGENSRQMAPVSTICDEYCRLTVQLSGNFAARLTSFFTYRKMLPRSTIVVMTNYAWDFFSQTISWMVCHCAN